MVWPRIDFEIGLGINLAISFIFLAFFLCRGVLSIIFPHFHRFCNGVLFPLLVSLVFNFSGVFSLVFVDCSSFFDCFSLVFVIFPCFPMFLFGLLVYLGFV